MKLLSFVLLFVFSVGVNAACDTRSLKGRYMFQGTYTGYKDQYPTTCGDIGIVNFDGNGKATIATFESCAGVTNLLPLQIGTYQLDALCSGGVVLPNGEVKMIFDKSLKNGVVLGANPSVSSSGIGTITKQ